MIAWIFPGQGSQFVGMGAHLSSDAARETFADARDVLGWDVRSVCVDGPSEALGETQVSQPAILTLSVAIAESLRATGSSPDVVAGHSVGEFAVLVAARAMSFEDALRTVTARARAMARAGRERPGGMAAILGLSLQDVERACAAARGVVSVAGINAPTQIVVSGECDAVDQVAEAARTSGARRVIPLDVSVAAHSPLMETAADELRRALEHVSIHSPAVPFVSCVSGSPAADPSEIAGLLCAALTRPVRWVETVHALRAAGTSRFLEIGPGRILSGLVRSILPEPEPDAAAIGDDDGIELLAGELTGGRAR
ncbi:MAG: ACP S-malonyltransferase [Actinomycetota bacterium]